MSAIYKIIGSNGQQYGPITGDQIRQWIAEGRVDNRTPVFVDGAKDWNFVGLLPEFAGGFSESATPPPIVPPPAAAGPGRMAPTNSYAQAGFIFGILSFVFCCCGFPFAVLGLVFSLIGLSQINAAPHLHGGRGLAIAGLVLSGVNLLWSAGSALVNLGVAHPHLIWRVGSI